VKSSLKILSSVLSLAPVLGAPCAFAAGGNPTLDYSRQFEGADYVFVPQKDLQEGVIFYRSYERAVSEAKPYSGLRQALVSYVVNEATRLKVEGEIRAKGFSPTRDIPQARQGSFCEPTEAILSLIGDRAKQFPPKTVAVNSHAQLCWTSFVFDSGPPGEERHTHPRRRRSQLGVLVLRV
jgi:hypothetical protein